jgi:hypothetical protein
VVRRFSGQFLAAIKHLIDVSEHLIQEAIGIGLIVGGD